jgi:transaldolase
MSKQFRSPLHEMATTTLTDFWNDSCSIAEIKYAVEYGAVGATTNPVIVKEVLKKEMESYRGRIIELIRNMPTASEDDIAWTINEEMAVAGAKLLAPVYEASNGQKGEFPSRPTPNTSGTPSCFFSRPYASTSWQRICR